MPRTAESHDYHCSLLDGPLSANDSVTYGVNHRSALNDLDNFHVANGQLPQDIMHVLFEGVLPYELKLMLHQFIFVKMYFSLQYLNGQIGSFAYSAEETRDKPPSLKEHDFKTDGHISMKGLFNCIFI